MRVTSNSTKSIVFIGHAENGVFTPYGTGFLVGTNWRDKRGFLHVVTAQHVITKIQETGDRVAVRINDKHGRHTFGWLRLEDWYYHPDASRFVDVAVAPVNFPPEANADYAVIISDEFATDEIMQEYSIGPGDEVFIAGYFRYFPGQQKNIPIVRIGNIAAMPDEPLITKGGVPMHGYLIEARSIGGLSGSPVFVQMPPFRAIDGVVRRSTGMTHYLLGLMHGHYDVAENNPEQSAEDTTTAERMNVGIGIVVPIKDILETLMQPDLDEPRQEALRELGSDDGPVVMDVAPEPEAEPQTLAAGDEIPTDMLNTPHKPRSSRP